MEHLRSISIFVRATELGSFATASAALGLTPSAVSKSAILRPFAGPPQVIHVTLTLRTEH
ncbi:LysR family transcriptional regulator [Variovorax sp. GT1P44]|uniref:LysR family transcriptional regulator n=1 Tax=Variovorax sp. GT1P44 TaxID=3443742 RepID=UPI003F446323